MSSKKIQFLNLSTKLNKLDIFGALILVGGGMVALLSLSTVKKVFQFQID